MIVGASPMLTRGPFQDPTTPWALSRFIDGSDVVVRMNNLKNMGAPGFGSKTDILAVTNSGAPGARYAERAMLDHPLIAGVPEIWFGSAPELIESGEMDEKFDARAGRDWAPAIVARQGWEDRAYRYIPASTTRAVAHALRTLGTRSKDPSLGARVVGAVLQDPRFAGHAVHVAGFGFRGADAHDFEAERRWFDQHAAAGRIARVPGTALGRWIPHWRIARLTLHLWRATHPRERQRLRGRAARGDGSQGLAEARSTD